MLALFCLRLALGLMAALLLLNPAQLNPRFYRTHFLTALALAAAALALLWEKPWPLRATLAGSLVLAFLGSASWSVEGHPGGRTLIAMTVLALAGALWLAERQGTRPLAPALEAQAGLWLAADDATSAALLGVATTAMLLGHSYLIAPSMSLAPLRRLLLALFVVLLLRAAVAGTALWFWTAGRSPANLTVAPGFNPGIAVLWLPLRWGLGFVLPAVLGGMARHTIRLRNTQSATGILYIVVVFCFLGELTSQLLLNETGYCL
jgi:hypothetical protein